MNTSFMTCALLACAALAGCETTGPQVNVNTAAGANDVACSVGQTNANRTVRIEAWRGNENSVSAYTTERVCQRLAEVSQGLLAQQANVRFDVVGQVRVHPDMGPADNTDMANTGSVPANTVRMVVVDALIQCGGANAPSGGFIRGCAPRIGQPVVFLNRTVFGDSTPEWITWAHELGHTVGLRHPDDVRPPTASQRIMTYMPLPESVTLDSMTHEPDKYAQLGVPQPGSGSGAAVGVVPDNLPPISAAQLIPFILATGQHGVPLQQLEHLSDTELLTLRVLLEPTDHINNATLKQLSVPLRINALVPLAELGRDEAQAYVRGYLMRQNDAASLDLRRYGLWALGRGQQRHPTEATRQFLVQAGQPGFWCQAQGADKNSCQSLASAAAKAQRSAGIKTTDKPR